MNANPIARWYRLSEYIAFGRSLQRRRTRFLHVVAGSRHALILGDGDGRFLKALLQVNPAIQVDYVEASGEMIRLARRRVQGLFGQIPANISLHHVDARAFTSPAANYDLIATHFFLDCFNHSDCDSLIGRLTTMALPGALWLISEFRQPEHGISKYWARFWIRACYIFFRVTTGLTVSRLPDYVTPLQRHGFHLRQREVSRTGLLVSELWLLR